MLGGASLLDELPDGLHVGLCGAGSPLPDPERFGPCVAVAAGERLFVIDSGSVSSRNLGRIGRDRDPGPAVKPNTSTLSAIGYYWRKG